MAFKYAIVKADQDWSNQLINKLQLMLINKELFS